MVTIWNVCIRTAVWWPISSFCKWGNWGLASSHVWQVPEQRSTLHVCQTGFWLLALLLPLFEFSPLPASQDTVYVPGMYTVNDAKRLHGTTATAAVTGVPPGLPQWWSSWQITFSVLSPLPSCQSSFKAIPAEELLEVTDSRRSLVCAGTWVSSELQRSLLSSVSSAVLGELLHSDAGCLWGKLQMFPYGLTSSPSYFSSVQSLSRVRLFVTPWIAARQASLSITNSRSSPRLTSIESVMPSSHLILCRPLLLLPPIPPSISLFQWVNSSHEMAKVLQFQL